MPIDYSRQIGKKMTTKGYHKLCVHIESIMYIQCHGGLATLFLNDHSQVDEIKTLKEFEEDLCGMGFIRIYKNTIVNGKYITKVNTNQGKRVVYLGEIELNVSRRQLRVLKGQLF
jgi:DNA-binding LytR/AlgR family response regulator